MDKKKLLAFAVAGLIVPTVGNWANAVVSGQDVAFTLGNVVAPAVPTILSTITAVIAYITNPNKKQ